MSLPSSSSASGSLRTDVEIEIVDGVDQRLELQVPAHAPRRLEILADPLAQVARLAHINHRPEAVPHQVNARLMRQVAQLLADVVRRRSPPETYRLRRGPQENRLHFVIADPGRWPYQ